MYDFYDLQVSCVRVIVEKWNFEMRVKFLCG